MAESRSELETLAQQVAELRARVDELGRARRGEPSPAEFADEQAGATAGEDPAEQADVALMAPRPDQVEGVGESLPGGGGVARRVPLRSLGGPDRHLAPLAYAAGMYLTRMLHKARRAASSTISEIYTGVGEAPLSVTGDVGLLAVVTASKGLPARVQVHVLPALHRGRPVSPVKAQQPAEEVSAPAPGVADDIEPLASAPRLSILTVLREGPASSTELQQSVGMAAGQMYHHLKPLAHAGFLRRDDAGRYAISGRGRKALLGAELLGSLISHDRFSETLERVAETQGDARFQKYVSERSSDVPLPSEEGSASPDA